MPGDPDRMRRFDEHPVSAVAKSVADGAFGFTSWRMLRYQYRRHTGIIHEFASDGTKNATWKYEGFDTSQRRDELLPDRVHLRRV